MFEQQLPEPTETPAAMKATTATTDARAATMIAEPETAIATTAIITATPGTIIYTTVRIQG